MWGKANLVLLNAHDVVWYQDHTGWSWIFGLHGVIGLLMIILIAAILVILLRLATRDVRSTERAAGSLECRRPNNAHDILEARYARGTIEREEYLLKKQVLS